MFFFLLMIRRPTRSTRTDTLFPYTTLFRSNFDKWVAVTQGTETGDYAAAISALRSPEFQIPEEPRAGLLSGYQALASGNAQAKTKAIRTLIALPGDKQGETVATMLAALGANREALEVARSAEHTSELQSLMRISSSVFCLKKTK